MGNTNDFSLGLNAQQTNHPEWNHRFCNDIILNNCHITINNMAGQPKQAKCETPAAKRKAEAVDNTYPEELKTQEARCLQKRLIMAGLINDAWIPVDLTYTQKGVFAGWLGQRLGIRDFWKTFGAIWNKKPDSLRSASAKGYGQQDMLMFLDRLKAVEASIEAAD